MSDTGSSASSSPRILAIQRATQRRILRVRKKTATISHYPSTWDSEDWDQQRSCHLYAIPGTRQECPLELRPAVPGLYPRPSLPLMFPQDLPNDPFPGLLPNCNIYSYLHWCPPLHQTFPLSTCSKRAAFFPFRNFIACTKLFPSGQRATDFTLAST